MEIVTYSKMVRKNGQLTKEKSQKYISFDGVEYQDMRSCREHEFDIQIEECKNKITNAGTLSSRRGIVPFDGDYHNPDDSNYYWFYPESEEQIAFLNKTFSQMSLWNDNSPIFDNSDVGKWVCVEDTYDRDFYRSSLEYQIGYVNSVLDGLGFQPVELKPKEES